MPNQFRSSIMQYDASNNTTYMTHGIFRWYGKLVPQLVSDILDTYTRPGDKILANFNGSGTIALEAIAKGIFIDATDINPLALLISRVKTNKLPAFDFDSTLKAIIELSKSELVSDEELGKLYEPEKWYSGETAVILIKLKKAIRKMCKTSEVYEFFLVCLLGIIRECSNIDSRCVNHIVRDQNRPIPNVYDKFIKECKCNFESVKSLETIEIVGNATFHLCDCRDTKFIADNSLDLVFSHPPYLNAINYYNIHRLCTDLADFDYQQIRFSDFSAKNHCEFNKLMEETYLESLRVLKPGKRLVVVIGDVRHKGNIIPLGVEAVTSLRKIGFDIEDIFIWVLKQKAGMSVARRGNHIDHNYVIIAKKKGD